MGFMVVINRLLRGVILLLIIGSTALAQDKPKFAVSASSKTLGYSPLWVAQKQGFFDRQGLDVQLVLVSGADKSTMALMGGSVAIAAIVFSPWPEPADLVMVNGRIVVEGGQLAGVDVPALVERADRVALALLSAASQRSGRDYLRRR